ncbi:MAG TPA: hypothetical protein VGM29_05795 [Polyangiaceae bacterium]
MLSGRALPTRVAALFTSLFLAGCPLDTRTLGAQTSDDLDAGEHADANGSAGTSGSAGSLDSAGSGGTVSDGGADASVAGSGAEGGTSVAGSGAGGTTSTTGAGGTSSAGAGSARASACPDLDQDSVADCSESLVKDSAFDSQNLADWSADPATDQGWQNLDADGRSDSGSLRVDNTTQSSLSGLTMSGTRQCIAAIGGASYEFFAKLYIKSDQSSTGSGGMNLSFYASTDCSGDALLSRTSNLPAALDSWSIAEMDADAPPNAQAMSVRLVCVKTFDAAPLSVLFDDVLVKQH